MSSFVREQVSKLNEILMNWIYKIAKANLYSELLGVSFYNEFILNQSRIYLLKIQNLSIYLRVALEILHISQFESQQHSSSFSSSGNSDASALVLSASTAALDIDAPIIIA